MSSSKAQTSKKGAPGSKGSPKKKQSKKGKSIQFQLTWSGLISWGVFAFVVVAWAFILGVLVGRGYQPETFLPLVSEYMPGDAQPKEGDQSAQNPVFSAQELGFFESLQQEATSEAQEPVRAQPQDKPEEKSNTGALATNDRKDYVYEYQVGAFKRRSQAEALQKGLADRGFTADVVRSTVQGADWYRVLVHYTGQASDVEAFTSRLRQAGVKKFFLRGKKAQ
ncbi:MAG: SPOR domain-containing protein [Desulfovermiculus sp.]